jgi:ubiquinone/menaquinone biosynthesis C-methylase UbiE
MKMVIALMCFCIIFSCFRVYHIDDYAVSALTKYYKKILQDGDDVLDICSSWVSHYPKEWKGGNVVGLGMNEYELKQNKQLKSYVVKDLNKDPALPFEANSFDKVTIVVSVDYLNKPREVFSEISRVLRPGGSALISMSNRWYVDYSMKLICSTSVYNTFLTLDVTIHFRALVSRQRLFKYGCERMI